MSKRTTVAVNLDPSESSCSMKDLQVLGRKVRSLLQTQDLRFKSRKDAARCPGRRSEEGDRGDELQIGEG